MLANALGILADIDRAGVTIVETDDGCSRLATCQRVADLLAVATQAVAAYAILRRMNAGVIHLITCVDCTVDIRHFVAIARLCNALPACTVSECAEQTVATIVGVIGNGLAAEKQVAQFIRARIAVAGAIRIRRKMQACIAGLITLVRRAVHAITAIARTAHARS